MRTLEIHRITGRSVIFGKVLLSATYNLFVVSILKRVYSPARPIESSTPICVEMQESTEQICPSIQTLPNNALNTVSLIQSTKNIFYFRIMNQENYSPSDLDPLLSKDSFTADDLLRLPQLFSEEPRTPSNQTSNTYELENLSITPTDKPISV